MKVVWLIKMCLNETYSTVWLGKNLSYIMFPIRNGLKQGLLFNLALEYALRKVQVDQEGLKLSGTHHLLVWPDKFDMLGGSVHALKNDSVAVVVASKASGLEVNADKTKYMVISQDQDAGGSHSIKIYNSSFARLEEFKYLGTTLTNQKSVQEELLAD